MGNSKKRENLTSRQRSGSLLSSLPRSDRSSSHILMIRLFSVLCKLNDIKLSDKKWFENAARASLVPGQPCPCCSARGCLRLFGYYDRYLVEWDGQTQISNTVAVPRECERDIKYCGHSICQSGKCTKWQTVGREHGERRRC